MHCLRFVRAHVEEHVTEVSRALVWRVVDTDSEKDRAGAWSLLVAVLAECGDAKSDLSRTALADKLALFLPYLIGHRWYSTMSRRDGADGASDGTLRKVISADVIVGSDHRLVNPQTAQALTKTYRGFLARWKSLWRPDVYQNWRQAVHAVERGGNYLSADGEKYLDIPATFRDSLWRLRRRSPRPSVALHVLFAYGWAPQPQAVDDNNVVRPHGLLLPATMSEVEALDRTMHPGVRDWLRRLVEAKGGCRLCDTWAHTEARCPCEAPFAKSPSDDIGQRRRMVDLRLTENPNTSGAREMSYMEAVERLHRHQIGLPLRNDVALDAITKLIMEEKPYEELLTAFDVVRGTVTGPLERHALWLHAGYSLLPSKMLFDKPSDDALSPSLERAERYLKAHRRYREWDQLLQAVEVLDTPFRRRALPAAAARNLEEIRETNSFFFCLTDGSLPASFTPGRYARVPEEVVAAAPLKDILCLICLDPFHSAVHCTKRHREAWDLQVARLVLEDNDLVRMRYPQEAYRLEEALRQIDLDDRQAKDFRKCELSLAVKLIHERRIPICEECNIAGHSVRHCEVRAHRILAAEKLRVVDVQLDPKAIQRRLREYQLDNDESRLRDLRDAYSLLASGSRGYPASYAVAIRALADVHIPLAAARYSTDAVLSFLLYINYGDLLSCLAPLREEGFPEVCLFCDSYHHHTEDCHSAEEEERGFLKEMRHRGLSLWRYLRKPDYYDERLPTDYIRGKESVLRLVRTFEGDYGPSGIARAKFMEHNNIDGLAAASQGLPAASTQATAKGGSSQRTAMYRTNFSQLIGPTATSASAAPAVNGRHDAATPPSLRVNTEDRHSNGHIFSPELLLGGLTGSQEATIEPVSKRRRMEEGMVSAVVSRTH